MESSLETIKAITNFIFVEDKPLKADLIIIPGSSQRQLPEKAFYLYKRGFGKKLIFTGGCNPKMSKKECNFGKEIAVKRGVPEKYIFTEGKFTNTKENAKEARKIVLKYSLKHRKMLLVCKPYHARRVKMTFASYFPDSRLLIIPAKDERNITKLN